MTLSYLLKKSISAFVQPAGLCLLLVVAGSILLRLKPRGSLGVWLVSLAATILLITSLPITSYFVLRPLEEAAGPCIDPGILNRLGVQHILVLGGDSPGHPRVAEGIRLWRHLPDVRLVISNDCRYAGSAARRFSIDMGVPESALVTESGASDTEDEANSFARVVNTGPFALVTSAWHIPRAVKLFQARGLHPVAAPCEHRAKEFPAWQTCLLPNADALLSSQLAIHEYMGMAWHWLKQKTRKVLR